MFQEASGANVIVSGGTNGFKVSTKSWITIKGFTVRSTTGIGMYIKGASNVTLDGNDVSLAGQRTSGNTSPGIRLDNTTSSLVINNVAHDNSDHGIHLVSGATGNEIANNISYGNARSVSRAAEGIFLHTAPGNSIHNNITRDNEDSGIGLWNSSNNNIVFNNVVYRNGDHGIDTLSSTGEKIVSNTVFKNVDSGIELQSNAGADLSNNISVDNGINSPRTKGNIRVVDSGSASQMTMDYNVVFLSADNDLIDYLGVKYTTLASFQAARGKELHGKQADPKFTNATAGDFHLLTGSPAIDSANSGAGSQPGADFDGRARVDDPLTPNTGVGPRSFDDRGAFEFPPNGDHPPVANNDSATTPQNTAVTVTVLANDTDSDNDPLTVTGASVPAHGTAGVNPNSSITYTPATGYVGPDSFTYNISDGKGGTASATVSITVTQVNSPPVATAQSVALNQDTTTTVTLTGTDPDNDPLRFKITALPAHAKLYDGTGTAGHLIAPGELPYSLTGTFNKTTYQPNANYFGPDSFAFKANDGVADSTAAATVSITVNHVNHAPVATAQSVALNQDTTSTVTLTGTDPDNDPLHFKITALPAHAKLYDGTGTGGHLIAPGELPYSLTGTFNQASYQPNANYFGSDSFAFKANDGVADSTAAATVSITVNHVNHAPVANNDSASTSLNTPVTVSVLTNDTDPDNDLLTVTGASTPGHGTTVVNAGATVTYTPATDYTGTDSFTYTISDGNGGTASATVSISVNLVNSPPVATAQSVALNQDTTTTVTLTGTDPDNDPLRFKITALPAHAKLYDGTGTGGHLIAPGELPYPLTGAGDKATYQPNAGYSGPDAFQFKANDGQLDSATATVSITVTDVNHAPVANNDSASTTQDQSVTVSVLTNDTDADNDLLTVTGTSTPAHGTTVVNAGASVTYTPAAGYSGPDSFTYTVSDGNGGTASATVSITVNGAPNLITNPGFEVNTAGWTAGSSSNSLTRVAGGHSGGWAAQLSNTSAGAECTLDDKPNSVAVTESGPYTARIWARSDTAGMTFKLRIREFSGGTVGSESTTVTLTSSWQQVSVVITPVNPGASSLDVQAYTTSSPVGVCFQADDVTLNNFVNAAPSADAQSVSLDQDTTSTVTLTGTDPDSDPLHFKITALPTNGNLYDGIGTGGHLIAAGELPYALTGTFDQATYEPGSGYSGPDAFAFEANDGQLDSAPATISITVTHVNHPPVANDDSASTTQDTPVTVSVLTNDTDPDNDLLTVSGTSTPAHGSTVVNAGATVTYTPDTGYSGPDSFTYDVSDGNGGTASATVSITVDFVNAAPSADAQSVSLDQDTTSTVTLTGTDPDSDPLHFKITALPTNGNLYDGIGTGGHLIAAGELPYTLTGTFDQATYEPGANYSGPDAFAFEANDGQLDSAPATISITVTHVNHPPVANDDSASTTQDQSVTVSVLTNDTDPDNDLLTVTGTSTPAHGTAAVNGNNTVTYTPTTGYSGPDSFTYDVSDGNGGTASATVSITVTQVNSPPVASAQSVSLDQDTTSTVTLTGTDPDSDPLHFKITALPTNGNLYDGIGTGGHLIAAGELPYALTGTFDQATYEPGSGYSGPDAFAFEANDGQLDSAPATVSITVTHVNHPPVANDDSASTTQDTPVTVSVLTNDTDPDNDLLTVSGTSTPAHGSTVVNAGATVTYTPTTGYSGPDSFTYDVSDGNGGTASATVSITVTQVNSPPVASAQSVSLDQDTTSTVTLTGTDPDSDPLHFKITALPTNGNLYDGIGTGGHLIAAGELPYALTGTFDQATYEPGANYSGPDAFAFEANDGQLDSAPATISITVTHVNHPPVANDDSASTTQDQSVTVSVLTNDTDPDNDLLTVSGTSTPGSRKHCGQRRRHRHLHPGHGLLRARLLHLRRERRQRGDGIGHRVHHGRLRQRRPERRRPVGVTRPGHDEHRHPHGHRSRQRPAALQDHRAADQRQPL